MVHSKHCGVVLKRGTTFLDFFVNVRDCHKFTMNGTGYISQNNTSLPKIQDVQESVLQVEDGHSLF